MYYVRASIGKCSANDSVRVRTVPYPLVSAGPDAIICFDDTTQLIGTINGTNFTWSQIATLINSNTLVPFAHPLLTTAYVLTAYDSLSGCPKPSFDTVLVTVRPEMIAFAGNDTSVVVGQPLQQCIRWLLYSWSPPTG
jgi:hypothetical protein